MASPVFANTSFSLWFVALAVISAGLLIGLMLVSAIFSVWLERKVAGRIQDRLGPTRVGGKFGWLQTLADGLKLLSKQFLVPPGTDALLFRLAPLLVIAPGLMCLALIPFSETIVALDVNVGLLMIFAFGSINERSAPFHGVNRRNSRATTAFR